MLESYIGVRRYLGTQTFQCEYSFRIFKRILHFYDEPINYLVQEC